MREELSATEFLWCYVKTFAVRVTHGIQNTIDPQRGSTHEIHL